MMPEITKTMKFNKTDLDYPLPEFTAPSFCIIPIMCSSFHFQFYLL